MESILPLLRSGRWARSGGTDEVGDAENKSPNNTPVATDPNLACCGPSRTPVAAVGRQSACGRRPRASAPEEAGSPAPPASAAASISSSISGLQRVPPLAQQAFGLAEEASPFLYWETGSGCGPPGPAGNIPGYDPDVHEFLTWFLRGDDDDGSGAGGSPTVGGGAISVYDTDLPCGVVDVIVSRLPAYSAASAREVGRAWRKAVSGLLMGEEPSPSSDSDSPSPATPSPQTPSPTRATARISDISHVPLWLRHLARCHALLNHGCTNKVSLLFLRKMMTPDPPAAPTDIIGPCRWICDAKQLLRALAKSGHLDMLGWSRDNGCQIRPEIFAGAAEASNYAVLRWAMEEMAKDSKDTALSVDHAMIACRAVASTGQLSVLVWIATMFVGPWDEASCYAALGGGHISVTTQAFAYNPNLVPRLDPKICCREAARGGHKHVILWVRDILLRSRPKEWNGCTSDDLTCAMAAGGGHLTLFKWLRDTLHFSRRLSASTCSMAALQGHLELLHFARTECGCPWNENTAMCAAAGGHLEVLQWLHASGCPWDEATCSAAAAGGYLHLLQWAQAQGCPWGRETLQAAERKGHSHIVSHLSGQLN